MIRALFLSCLLALAAYLPWIFGWAWPGPSLLVMGLCLVLSPIVDREMALKLPLPQGWVRLRSRLSFGLGALTLMLAATAMLLPVAIVATLAGVALVRRVDAARFYTLIYVLMVLLGIKLVADALMA